MSMDEACDWMHELTEKRKEQTRKYFIRMILGTDMENHKKHSKFIDDMIVKYMKEEKVISEEDKIGILAILLHAADIGNVAKPRDICEEWAKRCVGEFRDQGREEIDHFGKVSQPLMDKSHPYEKSQPGWIEYVMMPYYAKVNTLFGNGFSQLIQNLNDNLDQWKKYKEKNVTAHSFFHLLDSLTFV